ncbi:saccharopine dehydrogenase family protein [Sporosarcina gallistercoris]|uniref:Saccharopine dehydrogenase NADP-binding domain-containing protein n=1 Tax=Sporosarcina gallistercoris TaxID=2762245 RepID=A0ABR8PJT4_9BACL|nr:saccharopine dehydrogenase C-terminal domain-containing protein [Sporosarcina gallistercoris]MBD7908456.1 saccharopine dehydrogenase NADP-binding domain-containing protein [Sporosarcina gallistercoris]
MKVVVLGTGMIGTTIVSEIAKFEGIESVTAVDIRQESIDKCLGIAGNPKVIGKTVSLSTEDDFIKVLEGADVAVGCLPHSLSLTAVKAAIAAKCHLVDLVGSMFTEKMELHSQAQEAGVTIIPGCGVAPGITNFLAAQGIEMLDEADEAVLICGGIPRWPVPPLWYQVVFRLESVLGLYTKPAIAIKDGEIVEFPPLSELESLTFPDPVGECEAVITDAHSTAYTLKGKVGNLTEKTVRYPGHWKKMKVLGELGFLDHKPIEVDGVVTTPVKISEKILAPKMVGVSNEDVTVVRVEVNGTKNGTLKNYTWEMVDVYDHERNITSMAKTTALPATLAAKWIAEQKILETGVVPIETIIVNERFDPFVEELKELGIHIEFKS